MTYDQHDAYSDGSELDDLLQMLLSILSRDPADAQVNTVVGVLYNVSMDYKAAIHHFKKALESNPQDYALLNKVFVVFCVIAT
jgi:Tfp pilus assembly protein PilF